MEEILNNEENCIGFSFDKLDVLGVFGGYIFIRGEINYDWENECVIKIKKVLFHKTLKEWIKEKQQYCEHFKCFCGVNNSSTSDYKEVGTTDLLCEIVDCDAPLEYKRVKIFEVNSMDTECEHG
jgi:hypothetical protein